MTDQPIHILNQMGVITSFSIAKKISEEDITKFVIKGKKSGKSESEIERLLRNKIVSEIQTAIDSNNIPGLLSPQDMAKELGLNKSIVNNLPELNRIVMVIVHKLSEKKFDKPSLCYFVNSIVNLLGLSEEDFEKFHKQTGENVDSDDEDGDEDGSYGDDESDTI